LALVEPGIRDLLLRALAEVVEWRIECGDHDGVVYLLRDYQRDRADGISEENDSIINNKIKGNTMETKEGVI
jgi:hypothetical protein